MANKAFKTIPGTIDIPSDLAAFKTRDQVVWTGETWKTKGSFAPTFGYTGTFTHNPSSSIEYQKTMYSASDSTGLAIRNDAGQTHSANYELYGNGRWMPASIFNGIGFEVFQNSNSTHAVYLKHYALVFAHRETGDWRFYGVDTGTRGPSTGYRYINVLSNSPAVNTIRNWGPEWLFQGPLLHVANNGGAGSDVSNIYAYNMRVGSKMSTVGGQYRYLPAGKRSYGNRNAQINNVGFQDLFT